MQVLAAGILLRNKKILLGKRRADLKFYPGAWDIIGGHVEHNETPEQTLSRELREEIGVSPTHLNPIDILNFRDSRTNEDYECHIYLVIEWNGTPQNIADSEHSEVRWFRIPEALHLELAHPKYSEIFKSLDV